MIVVVVVVVVYLFRQEQTIHYTLDTYIVYYWEYLEILEIEGVNKQYKVAPMIFIDHDNHCPLIYLKESVASASSDPARQRLHCSTDTNQVRRPSLFCCRSDFLEQSPGVRQIDDDSC